MRQSAFRTVHSRLSLNTITPQNGKRKLKVTSNVARGLVGWTDDEKPRKKNNAWLKAKEIPAFLAAVDAYSGYLTTRLAAKLLFHTFVRKGELIEAKWGEIPVVENLDPRLSYAICRQRA